MTHQMPTAENKDEAAEGDDDSDDDGDMYDLGGETGGQVKKKKNQAVMPVASSGHNDDDDDEEENMYDLGGETGGQVAQARQGDDDEPLFSFVALHDGDGEDHSPIAPLQAPRIPIPMYEQLPGEMYERLPGETEESATAPLYLIPRLVNPAESTERVTSQASHRLLTKTIFQPLSDDDEGHQYEYDSAPKAKITHETAIVKNKNLDKDKSSTMETQTSKGSVYGFEEEEMKAASGSQDDKPDDHLELTADGLGKRKKAQK